MLPRSLSSVVLRVVVVLACCSATDVGAASTRAVFGMGILGNCFLYGPDGDLYAFKGTTLTRLLNAQGDEWETVKAGISEVAIEPANGKVMYAVTAERPIKVIKSLDKGKTWLTISNGLEDRTIYSLAIHPTNFEEVYVGTDKGVYKSNDAGFSWQATALAGFILRFHIDPNVPLNADALDNGKIRITSDGGRTWRDSNLGLPTVLGRGAGRTARTEVVKVVDLFRVNQNPSYLLAVLDNSQVYRSADNGASWQNANKGLGVGTGVGLPQPSFYASADEVFLSRMGQIFRSGNGSSWAPMAVKTNTSKVATIHGLAKHPAKGGLFVRFFFSGDSLAAGTERTGYIDDAGTLVNLTYGVTPSSAVATSWSVTSAGTSTLFATTYVIDGALNPQFSTFASVNDGYSWEPVASPPCIVANVPFRRPHSSEVWLVKGHGSMYRDCYLQMPDAKRGFVLAPGIPHVAPTNDVRKVAFDPANAGLLYFTFGVNDYSLHRYQYNLALGQGAVIDLKVPATDVVVSEDNSKTIFAGRGSLSLDGGFTWVNKTAAFDKAVASATTRPDYEAFRLLSFRGNEILAMVGIQGFAAFGTPGGFLVLRSRNVGDTWEIVGKFEKIPLRDVFINPDDSRNIIAAVGGNAKTEPVKVIETTDGGVTWKDLTTMPRGECRPENAVTTVEQVRSEMGRTLFIGGCKGMLRSKDEGKSWVKLGGIQ